jgi:hypothetical protein
MPQACGSFAEGHHTGQTVESELSSLTQSHQQRQVFGISGTSGGIHPYCAVSCAVVLSEVHCLPLRMHREISSRPQD